MKLKEVRWAVLLILVTVTGSVMSYGLIGALFGLLDRHTAISMVFVVAPMTVLMVLSVSVVIRNISVKFKKLTDAIAEISKGNLQYRIPVSEEDGEYAEIYAKFNAMAKELSKTKKEMEAFTDEFAHEFKTPITSISGFADLLVQTGEETSERMKYLKVIQQQSRRLLNLSVNTLLLSKLEASQILTDTEKYNLGEQIRNCVIAFYPQMENKHIRLDMQENFDCGFCGNPEIMEHVWMNLIGNAVKFTPAGGSIAISCEEGPGWLEVSVSDTGCGMTEETIRHIFEKYYQNDTKNLEKGSGIGLSIVKRVVELCRGEIRVSSVPGRGSTFTVHLPKDANSAG